MGALKTCISVPLKFGVRFSLSYLDYWLCCVSPIIDCAILYSQSAGPRNGMDTLNSNAKPERKKVVKTKEVAFRQRGWPAPKALVFRVAVFLAWNNSEYIKIMDYKWQILLHLYKTALDKNFFRMSLEATNQMPVTQWVMRSDVLAVVVAWLVGHMNGQQLYPINWEISKVLSISGVHLFVPFVERKLW